MPLSGAGFAVSDVQMEADTDPWQRRTDFSEEVNEDDMADDAARYASAAEEATHATELGAAASTQGSDAAQYDGQDLIDRANQSTLTSDDLGNGGEELERVMANIMTSIGLASDTVDTVNAAIDGGGNEYGLNPLIEELSERAESVHGLFLEGLEEFPADVEQPPRLEYDGVAYEATGSPGSWYVPAVLITAIRDSHIEVAAQQAGVVDGTINQAIEQYRHTLSGIAVDLNEDGYDLANSHLDYWRSEEMGEYNGVKFNEELQEEEPDIDKLAQYSLGLEGTLREIYDDQGKVRADFDPDSSQAGDYVGAFMRELSEDAFWALDDMTGEVPQSDSPHPTESRNVAEQIGALQRTISNGVIASLDPAAGGADPADIVFDGDGRVASVAENFHLPPGVAEYVYNMPSTLADLGGAAREEEMAGYDRFGSFMAHSTVSPGYEFSQDLADSAVEVQRIVANNNELAHGSDGALVTTESSLSHLVNNGGSDLLSVASRNESATAERLAGQGSENEKFLDTLLFSDWHDDQEAAEFIHSGTIMPEAMDPLGPEAGRFVEAGYNVLSTAGEESSTAPRDGIPNSNQLLTGAVSDTMVEYLDLIARDANPSSEFVDNGENPSEIFGEQHRYDFNLSPSERTGLFEMMLGSDEAVADHFNARVADWQYEKANNAFDESHDAQLGDSVSAATRVAGYMDGALISLDAEGRIDPHTASVSSITAIASAGIPYKSVIKFGAAGISELVRHNAPEFEFLHPDFHLESHLDRNGTMGIRHIVAQAAIDNDVDGMGEEDLPPPIDLNGADGLGSTLDDADQALDRLEADYDYLPDTANSLNENYQLGRNPEAPIDFS